MSDPAANSTVAPPYASRESWSLFWSLIVAGVLLSLAVVPGVFIIDEPNYLATVVGLRDGSWTVPATAGLPPSRELAAFDPEDQGRVVTSTPVSSLAPPLYALFALPFSWFGWEMLFLLNVLSFIITAWCVYSLVREHGGSPSAAATGSLLFGLGGFSIEYAIGMWPHMLSVALTSCAFLAVTRSAARGSMVTAIVAGLLAATAVGVREQSIVVVGGLGAALWTFSHRRWRSSAAYAAGAAVPFLLISAINADRLGTFHPFPKLGAYAASVKAASTPTPIATGGPGAVWWAKVVDFRIHPPFTDPLQERLFRNDPATGVPIVGGGVVKKALVQSAPWIALAATLLLVGWRPRNPAIQIQHRLLGTALWVVAPVFIVIALAGFGRSDGFAYNQRYFLELVPVFAAVAGMAVGQRTSLTSFFVGAVAGVACGVAMLALAGPSARYALIASVPLAIAALAVVVSLWSSWRHTGVLLPIVLGVALGWSFLIHLADDVRSSRDRRSAHRSIERAIEPHIPQGAALFTYWGGRDALGPLMMTKDVLLLDAWADNGADAVRMLDTLHARGRRVFVRTDGFPVTLLGAMTSGRESRPIRSAFPSLIEILPPS